MARTLTVNDFSKLSDLFAGGDISVLPACSGTPGEGQGEYKTENKTDIVTIMAYLIGLRDELFDPYFAAHQGQLVKKLREDREATVVRDLCILRQQLFMNYSNTEHEILYNFGNIDRISWFDQDAVRRLTRAGVPVLLANSRADDYSMHFTKLIAEHIAKCSGLFPEWIRFDFVRDLFYNPSYQKPGVLKGEFTKFHENKMSYPYGLYIHWSPEDVGNLFTSDGKFVKILYSKHGEVFTDASKVHDAVDSTKQSIYDFIDRSGKTTIVVDCENSDVFKLYGVLKNLNPDEMEKIEKIVLYDDCHTTNAWTWLKNFTKVPVEYVDVERVTGRKSLVDIEMTAGVCRAFYREDVDSFILCSSDSDFWGLISQLPEAKFLVMYEYSKCGQAIKDALNTKRIFHCALDDFYSGNAGDFQKAVLLCELRARAHTVLGRSAWEVTKEIYETTKISAKESEMKHFCEKYVKSIRLKTDAEGRFFLEVTEG